MVDECDKQLIIGKFVFDEENHEQKSRKFTERTCIRFLSVFPCQFFLSEFFLLASAIARIMLPTKCEETTVWVAIYQVESSIFYHNFYQRTSFFR